MKRAGTPGSGRGQASVRGTAKASANSRPAKGAAGKAPAPKKNAKGAKASVAKPSGKKPTKTVTPKTTKNAVLDAALKAAKSVAQAVTDTVKKAAKESTRSKATAKAAAAAEAVKAAARSVAKAVRPAKAPAAKATQATKPSKPAPPAAKTTKAPAKPASPKVAAKAAPASPKAPKPASRAPAKAKAPAPAKAPASKVAPKTAAKPSRTLRPKAFAELQTARDFGFPAETPELPDSYGEDTLVLMTKDPEYLFAYWDVSPERLALAERAKHAGSAYREALRLTWTSSDLLEDSFALLPVSLEARRWYLRVPFSGLSYSLEIGWLGEDGHFISLLGSSNPSDAPEAWAKTRERLRHADAVLEYTLTLTQPLGASESAPKTSVTRAPLERDYEGPGSASSSEAARAGDEPGKTRS